MNTPFTRALDPSLFQPPKIKTRAELFIEEMRDRIALVESQIKGTDRLLQLTAMIGGVRHIVRRMGSEKGDLILMETYELGAQPCITLAAIEQMAVTIRVVEKGEKERSFMGLNSFTRPANQR